MDIANPALPDLGELARLMETFNQATEKLGESYRIIGDLQKEIADKDRMLARKTRLEMLGRMAAGLAHEIRNPLGGIQLYASMLKRDLEADADKVRVLDRILGAISGLDSLVDDMLEFGRDLEPRKRLQPYGPLVEQSLDLLRGTVEAKRVEIDVRAGVAAAEMDGEMMQRVFLNLASNAVQAVAPGGRLSVVASGRTIAFCDDGPGIAPEILEKLFTPFLTSKTKGTGLGLAIAHKIVEAHGGTIEAKNGPAGGATFTINL
ncbi:MAG TPA: ATP-binding protein [Planctomycetota bacterium]|nr:ATP-binding protein [Planctomycetota bacterium]